MLIRQTEFFLGADHPLGADAANPQTQAKRKTAFTVKVPFVIDLAQAQPASDDPETDGIAEFESPMPNERYFRLLSTYALCDRPPTGELAPDAEAIYAALQWMRFIKPFVADTTTMDSGAS